MEKKNNENINNGKAKVLSSKSNSNINIQPRVVLQRLSKDYTFGVASRSDNQPSTSGYLSPKNKRLEVASSVSDNTSDSVVNCGGDSLATPSTSKPTTSGTYFRRKEVLHFRVAPLRETDPLEFQWFGHRHTEDSSDCSFYSSPKEVVVIEENKTDTEEEEVKEEEKIEEIEEIEEVEEVVEEREGREQVGCQECTNADVDKFDQLPGPESTSPQANSVGESQRNESNQIKIEKAIAFLRLLIETYSRRLRSLDDVDLGIGPRRNPVPVRRPLRSIVIRPQRSNLKDCWVRVWLPILGQKKKKKFHVRLAQLVSLLDNKNHPLRKFRNTLNLRTLRFLSDNELRAMARVLSDFACAKRVKF